MRRGGPRRLDAYYARGMLEIRTTLHLSIRLAVRANQALLRYGGAASEGAGLWRAALPAFVALDVVVWSVLRRDDRFGLRWRLPLDALDAAFWVLSPRPVTGHYDFAVFIAVPLAVEAGVRLGWRGMVVPAAVTVAVGLAAASVGKPVLFTGSAWLVMSVALGVAFLRYCGRLDDRTELERQRAVLAARRRAFLAGQNDVAMGASSAVDAIEGLVPVLGRPAPGSALWRLADGWKSDLRATTAQEAQYLQVAVLEWERHHNRHPDLSELVEVRVDEGHGTTLLSAAQVDRLHRVLDALPAAGQVTVNLHNPGAGHLPGQPLAIEVNGRTGFLPADRRRGLPPFDPCFMAYVYVFFLQLSSLVPGFGGEPPALAVAGAALAAVGGTFSHRRLLARGEAARSTVMAVGVVVALVLTGLSASFRSPITPEGDPLLGFGPGLLLMAFLAGYYSWFPGRRHWVLLATMVAVVVEGLWVFPVPSAVTARGVLASVLYNLFPYFPLRHLARALEDVGVQHLAAVEAVDHGAERAAFLQGRESVVGLVRQAREDALRQLDEIRPDLDGRLAELTTRRLEEVERRLQRIETGAGSSSSTTTS